MIRAPRSHSRSAAEPTTTVVTLPSARRRKSSGAAAARRRKQAEAQSPKEEDRSHGWVRSEDLEAGARARTSFLDRRRADGTPLLLFTALVVLTGVGLARVKSRIEVLATANELTELSEDQRRLLDRKRRLETERAYLRRPARVAAQASERLGMVAAPPERIQPIVLRPAKQAPAKEQP